MRTVIFLIAVLPPILATIHLGKIDETLDGFARGIDSIFSKAQKRGTEGKEETNLSTATDGTSHDKNPVVQLRGRKKKTAEQCTKLYSICREASLSSHWSNKTTEEETSRLYKLTSKITSVILPFFKTKVLEEAIMTGSSHFVADRCHAIKLECFIKTGLISELSDEADSEFPGFAKFVDTAVGAVDILMKLPDILNILNKLSSKV